MKCPAFLGYEPKSELPYHRLIYDFKNAQLLGFHIVTPQLPPRKIHKVILVWLPI